LKKYKDVAVAFLRAGALGFGGGQVCLPLIQREVVNRYQWFDNDEFGEIVAISNTLPGPLNTKMAGYVGYRVAGVFGAIIAVCSTVLPSVTALIILLAVLDGFRDNVIVASMTQAIIPVIGVMLSLMAWQFLKSAVSELAWLVVLAHLVVIATLIVLLNVHPAIIIGSLIATAILKPVKGAKPVSKEEQ